MALELIGAAKAVPDAAPRSMLVLSPQGRAQMQRDMELVRLILKTVQARTGVGAQVLAIDGHEPWVVARHIELLFEAGILEGFKFHALGDIQPTIKVTDLSWTGHDFIAAIDNETVWGQVKERLAPAELASLPLKIVKDLGLKLLEAYIMSKVGM